MRGGSDLNSGSFLNEHYELASTIDRNSVVAELSDQSREIKLINSHKSLVWLSPLKIKSKTARHSHN
jgi:hypothetical protein